MKTTLVALALLLVGCEAYDSPWENHQVPGGTSLGAYCDAVGPAACKRAGECGMTDTAACLEQFRIECCEGIATCAKSAPADVAASLTSQCVTAYAVATCEQIAAHATPAGCVNR